MWTYGLVYCSALMESAELGKISQFKDWVSWRKEKRSLLITRSLFCIKMLAFMWITWVIFAVLVFLWPTRQTDDNQVNDTQIWLPRQESWFQEFTFATARLSDSKNKSPSKTTEWCSLWSCGNIIHKTFQVTM